MIQFGTHAHALQITVRGCSELREEQFSQTHEGIPAMTLEGYQCGLGSRHRLHPLESLAFVEHLCTPPMLDIFLPTLLQ